MGMVGGFGLANSHLLWTREAYPTRAYQSLGNLAPGGAGRRSSGGPGDAYGIPEGICVGDPDIIGAAIERWESVGVTGINFLLNAVEVGSAAAGARQHAAVRREGHAALHEGRARTGARRRRSRAVITGTARLADLQARRPRLERFDAEPVSLPRVEIVQAMFEMPIAVRECIVPAGLHPTNPPALVLHAWRCPESPWGAFLLVQARAQTRSGVRPRGFVTGAACDNAAAGAALASGFGYPAQMAEIRWQRSYDTVRLEVARGGETVLALEGADPEPLAPGDVQFSGTLNLADTPRGWRLVQVDPEFQPTRAERLQPKLATFSPAAWGDPRLDPYYPVSASLTLADIAIPALRFVCRPEELAFTGTEKV